MPIELPPGTASYSDRTPPPKNRQIFVLLGLFIGSIIGVFWLVGLLVDGLVALIPYQVEQQLGALIAPAYEQLAKPSPTQDTLNELLDRMEAHLPEPFLSRDYQVLYVPDGTVNAAAIPGDRVILFQGLLDTVKSENELMMVLGHELGHFAHRDHLRQLSRGILIQLALAGFLGDAGSLQSIAISGVSTFSNARFSQSQEYQADDFGLSLLHQTYGHVAGATDFFERMSQLRGTEIAFLATHPSSDNRVRRLQAEIEKSGYAVGERSPLPDSLNH